MNKFKDIGGVRKKIAITINFTKSCQRTPVKLVKNV